MRISSFGDDDGVILSWGHKPRALQASSVRVFCGYRQRAHLLAEPVSSPLVGVLVQLHCAAVLRSARAANATLSVHIAELVFPRARQ
jgi:hypothetical protein